MVSGPTQPVFPVLIAPQQLFRFAIRCFPITILPNGNQKGEAPMAVLKGLNTVIVCAAFTFIGAVIFGLL
jgi:hypothetical protein